MPVDVPARTGTMMGGMARGWLLGVGAFVLVLGLIGAYITLAFRVIDVSWYGLLLIVAGIVQAVEAIVAPTSEGGATSRIMRLVLGLFYVAGGLYAVFRPTGAGVALTLVLGILLVASGAVRALWMITREGRHSRGLGLILALASAILGLLLISQWPLSGLWVIGLFVSADLIVYGLSWCWAAYAAGRG